MSFDVSLGSNAPAERAEAALNWLRAAVPEGYFYVRVGLELGEDWARAHPDDCFAKADGTVMHWASPASPEWRSETSRRLRGLVRRVAEGPHSDRFIGVWLVRFRHGQWLHPEAGGFGDYSPTALKAFRGWLRREYAGKGRLREAWGDPDLRFESAQFPTPRETDAAAWGPFRSPDTHQPSIDMQRFQHELAAGTIEHFAAAVKEATRGRSLVGASYGHAMDVDGKSARALAHSGQIALGKLLECTEVDLIHAPHSSFEGGPGQPGHFPFPLDSLALHGKLGILGDDAFPRALSPPAAHSTAPGPGDWTSGLEGALAVTLRNFANSFTHRCGMLLSGVSSNDRWDSREFWQSTLLLRRIAAGIRQEPRFLPEAAFIIDENSVGLLRSKTHPQLHHVLYLWRSEWARLGAPVGYYLQRDLDELPSSVKVLVMANAYRIPPPERRSLRSHLGRGGTIVWVFAPGIYVDGHVDSKGVAAVTGINVEPRFDNVPMRIICDRTGESLDLGTHGWSPRFVVTDAQAEALCTYEATGEVSAAATSFQGGVSVYTATPRLPVELLRWICRNSGVHLYRDTPGMAAVAGDYLFVHTGRAGEHEFSWPRTCSSIRRVVPQSTFPLARDSRTWSDLLPKSVTAVYECE